MKTTNNLFKNSTLIKFASGGIQAADDIKIRVHKRQGDATEVKIAGRLGFLEQADIFPDSRVLLRLSADCTKLFLTRTLTEKELSFAHRGQPMGKKLYYTVTVNALPFNKKIERPTLTPAKCEIINEDGRLVVAIDL